MSKHEIQELLDSGLLSTKPDREVLSALVQELVSEGFISPLPNKFFSFSNNLTWEVVYETLLFSERRKVHELVARYIEATNLDNIDYVSDLLIHHFEKSENLEKTVWYCAVAGDRAAAMYANDDAIGHYQRAVNLVEENISKPLLDICLLYEKFADVCENAGRSNEAVSYLEKALDVWRGLQVKPKAKYVPWSIRPSEYEASLCHKIGVSCERGSNYELATKWLTEALSFFPARPGRLFAKVYSTMCLIYYRQGEFQKAVRTGAEALRHARKRKFKKEMAAAGNMVGVAYLDMGQFQKTIEYLEEALRIYSEFEDFPGMANINANLGVCYQKLGTLDKSIEHHGQALELDEKVQNFMGISIDYNNLGEIYLMRGDLDGAISHLEKVIEYHHSRAPHPGLAGYAMTNLARALHCRGDILRAESMLEEGIGLLNSSGVQGVVLEAELFKSELLLDNSMVEEALVHTRNVLKNIRSQEARVLEAGALRLEGKCLLKLNRFEAAAQCLTTSLLIAKEIDSDYEIAKTMVEQVVLDLERSELSDNTQNTLQHALNIFIDMDARLEQERARKLLTKLQ